MKRLGKIDKVSETFDTKNRPYGYSSPLRYCSKPKPSSSIISFAIPYIVYTPLGQVSPECFYSSTNFYLNNNAFASAISATFLVERGIDAYSSINISNRFNNFDASKSNLEASKTNLEASKTNLEASKSNLEASKSNLEASKINLEASKINLEALRNFSARRKSISRHRKPISKHRKQISRHRAYYVMQQIRISIPDRDQN